MSISPQELAQLEALDNFQEYKQIIQQSYITQLEYYLSGENIRAVKDAVSHRYAPCSLLDLHNFLFTGFNEAGELTSETVKEHPLYDSRIDSTFQVDFGKTRVDTLSPSFSPRIKFLIEAIHYVIANSHTDTSDVVDEEEESVAHQMAKSIDEEYRGSYFEGTGSAKTTAIIMHWCAQARNKFFEDYLDDDDDKDEIAIDANILDALKLPKLTLKPESLAIKLDSGDGMISRLLNEARVTDNLARNAYIEDFYQSQIDPSVSINLDKHDPFQVYSGKWAENLREVQQALSNVFFLNEDGSLTEPFKTVLDTYEVDQSAFINLVQKEYRYAYDSAFDNSDEIRPYIAQHLPQEAYQSKNYKPLLLSSAMLAVGAKVFEMIPTGDNRDKFSIFLAQFLNQQIQLSLDNEDYAERLMTFARKGTPYDYSKSALSELTHAAATTPTHSGLPQLAVDLGDDEDDLENRYANRGLGNSIRSWVKRHPYLTATMATTVFVCTAVGATAGGLFGTALFPGLGTAAGIAVGIALGVAAGAVAGVVVSGVIAAVSAIGKALFGSRKPKYTLLHGSEATEQKKPTAKKTRRSSTATVLHRVAGSDVDNSDTSSPLSSPDEERRKVETDPVEQKAPHLTFVLADGEDAARREEDKLLDDDSFSLDRDAEEEDRLLDDGLPGDEDQDHALGLG